MAGSLAAVLKAEVGSGATPRLSSTGPPLPGRCRCRQCDASFSI